MVKLKNQVFGGFYFKVDSRSKQFGFLHKALPISHCEIEMWLSNPDFLDSICILRDAKKWIEIKDLYPIMVRIYNDLVPYKGTKWAEGFQFRAARHSIRKLAASLGVTPNFYEEGD